MYIDIRVDNLIKYQGVLSNSLIQYTLQLDDSRKKILCYRDLLISNNDYRKKMDGVYSNSDKKLGSVLNSLIIEKIEKLEYHINWLIDKKVEFRSMLDSNKYKIKILKKVKKLFPDNDIRLYEM